MARIISLGLTVWALLALPASGQSQSAVAKPSGPFSYDISREITLNGTVSGVLKKPGPGMIMGDHLLVATPSGTVDVSLGNSALQGKYGMTVTEGQHLQLTGVMKTLKGKQVFLARLVKVDGQLYMIRNEQGFPVSLRSASSHRAEQGVQP